MRLSMADASWFRFEIHIQIEIHRMNDSSIEDAVFEIQIETERMNNSSIEIAALEFKQKNT